MRIDSAGIGEEIGLEEVDLEGIGVVLVGMEPMAVMGRTLEV